MGCHKLNTQNFFQKVLKLKRLSQNSRILAGLKAICKKMTCSYPSHSLRNCSVLLENTQNELRMACHTHIQNIKNVHQLRVSDYLYCPYLNYFSELMAAGKSSIFDQKLPNCWSTNQIFSKNPKSKKPIFKAIRAFYRSENGFSCFSGLFLEIFRKLLNRFSKLTHHICTHTELIRKNAFSRRLEPSIAQKSDFLVFWASLPSKCSPPIISPRGAQKTHPLVE